MTHESAPVCAEYPMRVDAKKIKELMERKELKPTSLAKGASLSRARLHTILQSESSEVRDSTLSRIAGTLGVPFEDIIINSDRYCYNNFLIERYRTLGFQGFSLTQVRPLALETVFIPIRVRAEYPASVRDRECGRDRPEG